MYMKEANKSAEGYVTTSCQLFSTDLSAIHVVIHSTRTAPELVHVVLLFLF